MPIWVVITDAPPVYKHYRGEGGAVIVFKCFLFIYVVLPRTWMMTLQNLERAVQLVRSSFKTKILVVKAQFTRSLPDRQHESYVAEFGAAIRCRTRW